MVSRIPPKYRNGVLAILVAIALMLPEFRPVRELILSFALALLIALAIGFVVSLLALIPPIKRRGEGSPTIRLSEALILGALAFLATFVSLAAILGGRNVLGSLASDEQYAASRDLLVIGFSLIPAAFCVMFVWRFTRQPTIDSQPEDQ